MSVPKEVDQFSLGHRGRLVGFDELPDRPHGGGVKLSLLAGSSGSVVHRLEHHFVE